MWIDLTLPICEDLPRWPGTPPYEIFTKLDKECTTSCISLPLHFGTHIDAPRHFIPGGKTIDQIGIEKLYGIAQIIDTGESDCVNSSHANRASCPIVFFKTKNKISPEFHSNYCYISPEAAQILIHKNVQIVGIDYLSVEKFTDKQFTVHKILLKNEVLLVEGLYLENITHGQYEVMITPLIIKAEASPVRVLAKPLGST